MARTITIAPVRKTVVVEVSQAHAFEVFTNGIDRWWPKEHHIGEAPVKQEIIELHKGGRWRALHVDGSETINGVIQVWDPPRRIVWSWEINPKWKPEPNIEICSEVEVRFIAEGSNRTRLELEHRNFERMGEEGGKSMRDGVENGWPGILDQYKMATEAHRS